MRLSRFFWGRRSNWARVIIVAWVALLIYNSFLTGWGVLGVFPGLLEVAIVLAIFDAVKKRRSTKTGETE